jgi:hypothetical protein
MRKLAALILSLFLTTGMAFADSPKDTPKEADAQPGKTATAAKTAPAKSNAEISAEMEELRQALQAQQEQLQLLKEELAKRDRQIEEAREAAASANSRAIEANVKASEAAATSAEVKTTTSALNSSVASLASSNAAAAANVPVATPGQATTEDKGPTTIRFKGVNITPHGFLAAETVNRNHATSGDIATAFNAIPYNGNSLAKVSEFNFTGRQSRLSLLVDTKFGDNIVKGFYEADFLGVGVTSNNRQTNSYVYRQRQLWAEVITGGGLSITGGQMWSLATENREGIQNMKEWFPQMIDPNYVVGYTWDRAYGFRLAKNFDDKIALAFSVEGPQTTIGGSAFTTYTSTSATGAVTTAQNFWLNAPGNAGGLYNSFDATGYTPNKLPDFIFKAAFDPGWGHYEVLGIVSEYRNRIYPCSVVSVGASNATGTVTLKGSPIQPAECVNSAGAPLTAPSSLFAYNNSSTAGGVGVSARLPLIPSKLDFGVKVVAGSGIGRFGSAQLADVTARPDGTLAQIRNEQSLVRLEWHPTPKWDVYAYWGNEYAWRAAYVGYTSVAGVTTPAIPATYTIVGGVPVLATPAIPATTTWTTKTGQPGGYGSPYRNNSGCSVEIAPTGTGTPSAPANCVGDNRNIEEFTVGFWNKIFQGEKGRLQWGLQYSYLQRFGYSGNNTAPTATVQPGGISPKATDNMFLTSFRYYLP